MTYQRKNLYTPHASSDIVYYGAAVEVMKARSPDDPTGWTFQAAIHGTYQPPDRVHEFNQCKHGSWYFVAWHRMYVYWFERIARKIIMERSDGAVTDWALPYWNYDPTDANPGWRYMPPSFRDLPSVNPLWHARATALNNGTAFLPDKITNATSAFNSRFFTGIHRFGGGIGSAARQFLDGTGFLENTPHNTVHDAIGNNGPDTVFDMGDPHRAARDPIFWMHHCNIDRLWAAWNAEGHQNPTDPAWLGQSFTFYDEDGNPVSMKCSEIGDIAGLGYTYEDSPTLSAVALPTPRRLPAGFPWIEDFMPVSDSTPSAGDPTPDRGGVPDLEIVGASDRSVVLRGDPERVTVSLDRRALRHALHARPPAADEASGSSLILTVENIEAERNPGGVYGVYVNAPDDVSPGDLDAYYAGNVSFFGVERVVASSGDAHLHGMRLAFDITALAVTLQERGEWRGDSLDVTFRPIPLGAADDDPEIAAELARAARHVDTPVTIGRVSVHLA